MLIDLFDGVPRHAILLFEYVDAFFNFSILKVLNKSNDARRAIRRFSDVIRVVQVFDAAVLVTPTEGLLSFTNRQLIFVFQGLIMIFVENKCERIKVTT